MLNNKEVVSGVMPSLGGFVVTEFTGDVVSAWQRTQLKISKWTNFPFITIVLSVIIFSSDICMYSAYQSFKWFILQTHIFGIFSIENIYWDLN